MTEEPAYAGLFPWMTQWWLDHLNTPPAVVIRCGHPDPLRPGRQCRNAIGEVKAEGECVLAMTKNDYPEVTADWTPLAALTVEELAAEMAERDAQALRYIGNAGDGNIVYKRKPWPREVGPIDMLRSYFCRVHGRIEVDTADLAAFIRDAPKDTRTVTRTYCPTRDVH